MTAVAGRRMAETVARRGGITVIPQDIPIDVVSDVIAWVKSRDLVHDTPITLTAHDTVGEALSLLSKRAHGAVIVVDLDNRPVGVATEADRQGVDMFTQLGEVMTPSPQTVPAGVDPQVAFDLLHDRRHKLAPVVDGEGTARGRPHPHGRAARDALPARRRRLGPAADRGGRRHQRRRRRQGQGAGRRPAPTCSSWTPPTATRRRCSPRLRAGPRPRPGRAGRGRERGDRRGVRDLVEAGPTSSRWASGRARCARPG